MSYDAIVIGAGAGGGIIAHDRGETAGYRPASEADRELPAVGHGIARVDAKIHDNLMDLGRVNEHAGQISRGFIIYLIQPAESFFNHPRYFGGRCGWTG